MPSNDTTTGPQQHVSSTAELGVPLKPCPWCRTSGALLMDLWDTFDAGHIAHVHCSRCGAFGPSVYGEKGAPGAIRHARNLWNTGLPPNTEDQRRESAGPQS